MKVLPWFALLFACTAVPADAHLAFAGTPKIDLFSSARLIDTNQSQSLEAVSTADGDFRLPSCKLAGVYFITGNNGQTFDNEAKDNDFTDPTGDNCKRLGFAVTSCASGLFNRACPYNDRIYDKCCEASYTYEASNCPAPRKLSSETCGGKHRCYCDTAQYPFASCSDPQIKGNACTDDGGTRYATCVCPNPVSTPYGCETYYAAPCGSVCKKAYADNCRNRTAVSTPYGCAEYWSDCSSKCKTKYNDNCRNRSAVISSCPANATCSYFSDCSSKIQSWSCKSGYTQEGSSCIADNPCPGYEQKSSCPNKYYNKEVCSKDSSYIKCTPTCGSRIVDDNPSYKIDEGNSGGVVVVTKSGSYLPYGNTIYSNVNFPQYSECAALSKPTITLTASNGYAASISTNRIENIDFIVNFKAWTQPDYCSAASQYRYSSFCTSSCSSYDCYCRSSCMSNSSCRDYSIECMNYYDAMVNGSSHMDLCEVANNYDSYCTNTNSPSVGVKLDPNKQIRTETYTNNGKSSTRYYYEGTLKNVNITVNGSPQIAAQIGGGAHYDKTIKFEGTNSISGGSKHSVWARGHNTYAYGIVRGVLQVNSGAKLTLNKPACIYTQWNGSIVKSGTVSGTVTTNCSTYPLKW